MDQNNLLTAIFNKVTTIEEKMVTKDEHQESKSEIITHVDGFIKLHQTVSIELVAMRSKYERLEQRIEQLELKVGLAST